MLPLPIPRPLVEIALGGVISLVTDLRITLDPEMFFLLLVPPLLFLDGWRIPREELLKDRTTILELALGLVVFTVAGVGYVAHWLILAMPLTVTFALAAVVSPTDPVAVSAIARRAPVPKRLMHIVEAESLSNDASGLVCLRFAIAAALTGTFSLSEAALNFLWLVLRGIAMGTGITWATMRAKQCVARRIGEESGSQIIISLLIPFASCIAAERLHSSGILAAVSAGLTMSVTEASGRALGATRMRRATVWDAVQFAANGVICVLLGEQLPAIVGRVDETVRMIGHSETWWLLIYVLVIYFGPAAVRFLWVWVSLNFTMSKANVQGAAFRRPHW
jgi:CPA1 family monovalent cation:H+ antiporter